MIQASDRAPRSRTDLLVGVGLAVAVLLMALAMIVPAAFDWNVRVRWFPPLHAEWDPRVGIGTLLAVPLALLLAARAVGWCERAAWPRLLTGVFLASLAWMVALALVDGVDGLGEILDHPYEYLGTARATDDVGATLEEYVSRIRYDAEPRNWPVHIAGHPPGALLFFVVLVRLGLGDALASGTVVILVAATTPIAVLQTLRILGAGAPARRAAPFLAVGPAAVWQAVSADAMFAAVVAWGVLALVLAAVRARAGFRSWLAWAVLAGLLLGYTVMLSYGLWLVGVLALVALWLGGSWRPFLPVALVAAAVVGAFALAGFEYWEAIPAIRDRYFEGVGGRRPPAYWMWGNLAALMFSAGPMAGAAAGRLVDVARAGRSVRAPVGAAGSGGAVSVSHENVGNRTTDGTRVVVGLATAGWLMVLLADLSQMSRAEVERIWLPFVPWVLVACALLPPRWRRAGLALQLLTALLVQHLLDTGW